MSRYADADAACSSVLRSPLTCAALAALLLFSRCFEIFVMDQHARSGIILLCGWRMLEKMLYEWFPPMLLTTTSFGLGLNLLAASPHPEQRPRSQLFKDLASLNVTLDLEVEGSFWAPLWSIFDMWYTPEDLAQMHNASVITPVFVWLYLTITLVLVVNLLIAMFNQEFTKTIEDATNTIQMSSCRNVNSYIAMYPVPPPLNVIALVIHGIWLGARDGSFKICKCCMHLYQGPQRTNSRNSRKAQRDDEKNRRHYPPSLHLPDKEVEAILVQARDKLYKIEQKEHRRAEETQIARQEKLEALMKEHDDKVRPPPASPARPADVSQGLPGPAHSWARCALRVHVCDSWRASTRSSMRSSRRCSGSPSRALRR